MIASVHNLERRTGGDAPFIAIQIGHLRALNFEAGVTFITISNKFKLFINVLNYGEITTYLNMYNTFTIKCKMFNLLKIILIDSVSNV